MSPRPQIEHDEAGSRFRIHLTDGDVYLAYRRAGNVLDFYYTYVPLSARGKGIAEQVVKAGFAYAREHGLTIVPSCPYVSDAYLKRHPKDREVVQSSK